MPRTPRDVTDAELAVLEIVWADGPSTIRDLAKRLYDDEGASACATVQKLLTRLVNKEIVERRTDESPIRFAATIGRAELISRRLQETAEKLCEGSLTPLLTQLVRSTPFTDKDRQTMLELIDKLANKKKSGKPGKGRERTS